MCVCVHVLTCVCVEGGVGVVHSMAGMATTCKAYFRKGMVPLEAREGEGEVYVCVHMEGGGQTRHGSRMVNHHASPMDACAIDGHPKTDLKVTHHDIA